MRFKKIPENCKRFIKVFFVQYGDCVTDIIIV